LAREYKAVALSVVKDSITVVILEASIGFHAVVLFFWSRHRSFKDINFFEEQPIAILTVQELQ
jgi:hypothetical protein